MSNEVVGKVEKVNKASRSVESFQRILDKHMPNRDQFETIMQRDKPIRTEELAQKKTEKVEKPSLMEEVTNLNRKVEGLSKRSYDDLIAQARDASTQIEQVKGKLENPDLRLRGSVQQLLKNKLGNIEENLQVALTKAGLDYQGLDTGHNSQNPVVRFLDMLAHGQNELDRMAGHIHSLAENKADLAPADLLSIQIKVGHVQQELEFFTSLLNKSLESTKTLMNVQV